MSHVDLNQEWQRLYELYSKKSDEELLELREDFDDLTEVAQGRLREELQRRKLWIEDKSVPAKSPPPEDADDNLSGEWTDDDISQGGAIVAACETAQEVNLCAFLLNRADIRTAVTSGHQKFTGALVKVAPNDGLRAEAILAEPIPPSLMEDFRAQSERDNEDFEVPACPQCGSTDIMLEAAEPTNQWLCDSCEHK